MSNSLLSECNKDWSITVTDDKYVKSYGPKNMFLKKLYPYLPTQKAQTYLAEGP